MKEYNFDKLLKKEITPPFKPNSKEWEKYFDEEFTKEEAINS